MADLSNLLGDVYGDPTPPAPSSAPAPEPPAWADESRLDEAFADWTPEPLEAVVADSAPRAVPSARLDDDLAAALSAALADAPRAPVAAAPVTRFAHVDADAALVPPVLDGATLEPAAEPAPDSDPFSTALDAIVVTPPTAVETAPRKRSLPLTRSRKTLAPPVAPAPVFTEPAVTAVAPAPVVADRPWQPSDDDILPARTSGRKSGGFRLR